MVVQLLGKGQAVRFQASGGSMRPTIREGESITVEPVKASEIKQGDILLCQMASGLIAARLANI